MKSLCKLLRPHQWIKNFFIFLPLFFDKKIFEINSLVQTLSVFVAFSLASSAIYCLNDIRDVEADRLHPTKCKRPIASGAISRKKGWGIMICCIALSALVIGAWGGQYSNVDVLPVITVLISYFIMNIAYCIKLKHIPIMDVFIIAIGFVLRVIIGGFATDIYLSHWIVLMTFLLASFLAFAKRRDDVLIYENTGSKARKNITCYTLSFINQVMCIVSSITMVCYIMYTVSPEVVERLSCKYLYMTSVFVLAAMIRYLQVTVVYENSGSPTKVLIHDRFLQACIAGWLLSFVIIIYL